jgi:GDP-4-dehydro-6-deoxy-D-mannose reductase
VSTRLRKTVLVTGAGGFVGRRLLAHLQQVDPRPRRVVAVDICSCESEGDVEWRTCDITDPEAVASMIDDVQPGAVIHLAGVTDNSDLAGCFSVNVLACHNLLAAAGRLSSPPRVLVVGSAAMYGITEGEREIVAEDRPLLGRTPYGVSKIMQEQWALTVARERGLPVVCVRPFNIIGPGQSDRLVPATFLRQVADVSAGRAECVLVGNTATERDFTDVRDIVTAMWMLITANDSVDGRVFNIASGEAVKIADIVDACVALGGGGVDVVQDPQRMKKIDVPCIVGDPSRLRRATGWSCRIDWRQSLQDMWRQIVPDA